MALPIPDDEAYALLQELWQAQDPEAMGRGTLEASDAWLTRLARALASTQPRVQELSLTTADGVCRLAASVATPFGTVSARIGLAPEHLRIDESERVATLRVREPLALDAGMLGGLLSMLGGSAEALFAKAIASTDGLMLDDDLLRIEIPRLARVEELCTRPWLGRPLCHYVQIVGCVVGEGRMAIHWRTGLDAGGP